LIEVPYERLDKDTLIAIIEEFVLREGTDYGSSEVSFEVKIDQIFKQLKRGDVVITFDPMTENCTLISGRQFKKYTNDLSTS
jgi:uncharacterized protein YheU (UPF0270 family)